MNLEYLKTHTQNKATRALCGAIQQETGYLSPNDIKIKLYLDSINYDLNIVRALLLDKRKLSYTNAEWYCAEIEFKQIVEYYKNYNV